MKKVAFVLCLLCMGLALTQVAQSDTSASIVFPQGATAVEVAALNANYGSVIPTAKWIWANSVPGTGKKNVTFEILKYLGCTGDVTLTSAAFGKRYIYWDGVLQGTYSNWQEASNLVITPKCGRHNLTIVVEITVGSGYAGLVFLLQQDRTNCYNCNSNGFWNEWTCQCECLTTACTCPSNKNWTGYPTCACKCPPRPIIFQAPIVRNLQTSGVAALSLSPVSPTLAPVS
jgi:hypothetical protein